MGGALRRAFPGVNFAFSQYIQDNVQEAASGINAENAIKISGATCDVRRIAVEVRGALEKVRGITDIQVPPLLGQPTIRIDIDRQRAAATACRRATSTPPSRPRSAARRRATSTRSGSDRHFPMKVRLAPQYRQNMEALRRIAIGAPRPNGSVVQVPLAEVATIGLSSGAFYIYREQQERYIPVKFSVRGRDLGGAVLEAQQKVARGGPAARRLPARLGGRFRQLPERDRPAVDRRADRHRPDPAPALRQLRHARDTLLAGSAIPMALIGGILGLALADMSFSISAAIGFVALFGIAAMNGIMVVGCFNRLVNSGLEREAALRETCTSRCGPC